MAPKEIEKIVSSYIEQSKGGLDKEHPKFDFKRKWYDLSSNPDINEFLKDTTSIANTVGLDGFIVIGFDDKNKEFYPATFKDSNLRDPSDITNLINKKIDRLFELNTLDIQIQDNNLSVIHIPPSIDKPHVIKLYQTFDKQGNIKKEEENKVFVRKNSRTSTASKYDYELMYYDRKNIIPDYELHSNFNSRSTVFNCTIEKEIQLTIHLTIENTGRRPVAIGKITFSIEIGEGEGTETIKMISDSKYIANNLIVKNGEIWNGRIDFYNSELIHFPDATLRNIKLKYYNQKRKSMRNSNLDITLANGKTIYSELIKIV